MGLRDTVLFFRDKNFFQIPFGKSDVREASPVTGMEHECLFDKLPGFCGSR